MRERHVPSTVLSDRAAANIRNTRKALRMTLADMSRRLEEVGYPMGINTLSRIERGGRLITIDDLDAISLALGLPAAWSLLADQDSPRRRFLGELTQLQLAEERIRKAHEDWYEIHEALVDLAGDDDLLGGLAKRLAAGTIDARAAEQELLDDPNWERNG